MYIYIYIYIYNINISMCVYTCVYTECSNPNKAVRNM